MYMYVCMYVRLCICIHVHTCTKTKDARAQAPLLECWMIFFAVKIQGFVLFKLRTFT